MRASGFIASFILARYAGTVALGNYSAVANSAATAVHPVLALVANVAPVHGNREGKDRLSTLMQVYARLGLGFAAISAVAFVAMFVALDQETFSTATAVIALAAGLSSLTGQILTNVLQGVCYGTSNFRVPALIAAGASVVTTLAMAPATVTTGLAGALGVLAVTSTLSPLALFIWGRRHGTCVDTNERARIYNTAKELLRKNSPVIASTVFASVSSWFSLVLFVHHTKGAAGVGMIALGSQWTTLLVLAVTSWSGVTLQRLATAVRMDDPGRVALRAVVLGLVGRHLAVTGVGAALVWPGAGVVANAYGTDGATLATLLRINSGLALVLSCSNVCERLLFCLDAQSGWVRSSLLGNVTQLVLVLVAARHSLEWVAAAVLAGALVTLTTATLIARLKLKGSS